MATEIKTLACGRLKLSDAAFQVGERILYAAPHPLHPPNLQAITTAKRTALITSIRLFSTEIVGSGATITVDLFYMRYSSENLEQRPRVRLLAVGSFLRPQQLRVDTVPVVLEEGDLIVSYAVERDA